MGKHAYLLVLTNIYKKLANDARGCSRGGRGCILLYRWQVPSSLSLLNHELVGVFPQITEYIYNCRYTNNTWSHLLSYHHPL